MKNKKKNIGLFLIIIIIFQVFLSSFITKAASMNINEVSADIALLENLADTFISQTGSTESRDNLVLGYITNGGYDSFWNDVIIKSNDDFKSFVENYEDKDLTYLKDLGEISNDSTKVNFHLLVSTLNSLRTSSSVYMGWGYLVTNKVYSYGESSEDIESLTKNISYSSSDANAVIDAINIYNSYRSNKLSDAIRNYYTSITNAQRFRSFTNSVFNISKITKENLRNSVYSKYTSDGTCTTVLNNKNLGVSNANNAITASCNAFADYIFSRHPDAELSLEEPTATPPLEDRKVTSIKIKNLPESLNENQIVDLSIEILPEELSNDVYKLSASNNVVSFDGKVLKANKSGETIITITDSTGTVSSKYNLKVYGKVTQITTSKDNYTLNVGDEVKLTYNANALSNEKVIWNCTSDVISLSNDGLVKALKMGEAKVICQLESDKTIFCSYTINVKSPIDSLSISNKTNSSNPNGIELGKNQTFSLNINVSPSSEKANLSYRSSDTSVCIVEKGVLKAIGEGECTITVYSSVDETKRDTVKVYVLGDIQNVSIPKSVIDIDMAKSKTDNLKISFYPERFDSRNIKIKIYKIGDDGEEKQDYNQSALSYDYLTGEIVAKKVGTYRISICNGEGNELGSFTVNIVVNREDDKSNEPIINQPIHTDIFNFSDLKVDILKILRIGLFIIALVIIIYVIRIIIVKKRGYEVYDEDNDYKELNQKKALEEKENIRRKFIEEDVSSIRKDRNVRKEEIKKEEKMNEEVNNMTEDEFDKIIEDISSKSVNDEEFTIDGMSIDEYLKEDLEEMEFFEREEKVEEDEKETLEEEKEDIDNI